MEAPYGNYNRDLLQPSVIGGLDQLNQSTISHSQLPQINLP